MGAASWGMTFDLPSAPMMPSIDLSYSEQGQNHSWIADGWQIGVGATLSRPTSRDARLEYVDRYGMPLEDVWQVSGEGLGGTLFALDNGTYGLFGTQKAVALEFDGQEARVETQSGVWVFMKVGGFDDLYRLVERRDHRGNYASFYWADNAIAAIEYGGFGPGGIAHRYRVRFHYVDRMEDGVIASDYRAMSNGIDEIPYRLVGLSVDVIGGQHGPTADSTPYVYFFYYGDGHDTADMVVPLGAPMENGAPQFGHDNPMLQGRSFQTSVLSSLDHTTLLRGVARRSASDEQQLFGFSWSAWPGTGAGETEPTAETFQVGLHPRLSHSVRAQVPMREVTPNRSLRPGSNNGNYNVPMIDPGDGAVLGSTFGLSMFQDATGDGVPDLWRVGEDSWSIDTQTTYLELPLGVSRMEEVEIGVPDVPFAVLRPLAFELIDLDEEPSWVDWSDPKKRFFPPTQGVPVPDDESMVSDEDALYSSFVYSRTSLSMGISLKNKELIDVDGDGYLDVLMAKQLATEDIELFSGEIGYADQLATRHMDPNTFAVPGQEWLVCWGSEDGIGNCDTSTGEWVSTPFRYMGASPVPGVMTSGDLMAACRDWTLDTDPVILGSTGEGNMSCAFRPDDVRRTWLPATAVAGTWQSEDGSHSSQSDTRLGELSRLVDVDGDGFKDIVAVSYLVEGNIKWGDIDEEDSPGEVAVFYHSGIRGGGWDGVPAFYSVPVVGLALTKSRSLNFVSTPGGKWQAESFAQSSSFPTLSLVDINGDGFEDFASLPSVSQSDHVEVYFGTGDGWESFPTIWEIPTSSLGGTKEAVAPLACGPTASAGNGIRLPQDHQEESVPIDGTGFGSTIAMAESMRASMARIAARTQCSEYCLAEYYNLILGTSADDLASDLEALIVQEFGSDIDWDVPPDNQTHGSRYHFNGFRPGVGVLPQCSDPVFANFDPTDFSLDSTQDGLRIGPGVVSRSLMDVDGDGRPDLVESELTDGPTGEHWEPHWFRNVGGGFSPVERSLPSWLTGPVNETISMSSTMAAGTTSVTTQEIVDFNNDGMLDLVKYDVGGMVTLVAEAGAAAGSADTLQVLDFDAPVEVTVLMSPPGKPAQLRRVVDHRGRVSRYSYLWTGRLFPNGIAPSTVLNGNGTLPAQELSSSMYLVDSVTVRDLHQDTAAELAYEYSDPICPVGNCKGFAESSVETIVDGEVDSKTTTYRSLLNNQVVVDAKESFARVEQDGSSGLVPVGKTEYVQ